MIVDLHAHIGQRKSASYTGDQLLADMDASGVAHACVFSFMEDPDNGYPAEQAQRRPDRLTAFCVVDPWDAAAVGAMRSAYREGMRGTKFHPLRQAVALDRLDVMGPFLDLCAEYDAVFFAHGGSEAFNSPGKFAALARRWPEVTIVIGHSGEPWGLQEAIDVGAEHPTVHFSTSLVPVPSMRRIVEHLGPDRLLMASDVPFGSYTEEVRRVRAAFGDSPTTDRVLGGTLASILGLHAELRTA